MSPVSHGRTPKKNKKKSPARQGGRPPGAPARPAWFKVAINSVLEGAEALVTAEGPREIEETTAALLGAELDLVVQNKNTGLFFDDWFEDLVATATAQIKASSLVGDDSGERPWRLLQGLSSLTSSEVRQTVRIALRRAGKWRRGKSESPWVGQLGSIAAVGDVWELRDAYGTRFGMVANFAYPEGLDPTVFLWDVDASGFIALGPAGVYDGVEQAADAWREMVGDTAANAELQQVEGHSVGLSALAHCGRLPRYVMGNESRTTFDNWFRARRRIADLDEALHLRGRSLVDPESLFAEPEDEDMATQFADWYHLHFGAKPRLDAVEELATEWMESLLPETWFSVSPLRINHFLGLLSDWLPEDSLTVEAKLLLPKWAQWLGETSGLPSELVERVVADAGSPYVAE
jgi:hypothetical protein